MEQQRDLAQERFNALVGAPGITAEAREYRNDQSLSDEQAVHVILGARWPHLTERAAHEACARRYDVVLPTEWQPWTGPRDRAPLPGHEHVAALASIQLVLS